MSIASTGNGARPSVKPKSLLDALKTVLAGFLGVRARAAHERGRTGPVQIVIAAIILAALFVLALRAVVHFITS